MSIDTIIDAYRWQRALGHQIAHAPHGRIIFNPACPSVWDANHADSITAQSPTEIDLLFAAMEERLAHSPWRVVHTDPFTSPPVLARLAFEGYEERPAIIQMQLAGPVRTASSADIRPVETETDWRMLAALLARDHEEGARTGGSPIDEAVTRGILAGYRAKQPLYRFHLAYVDGMPAAYGALAMAPNGAGMIDDLFTLPAWRRRGLASAMIRDFAGQLHARGCHCVFLGAMAGEQARHLYARLGFHPLLLTRCWVRRAA